MYVTKQDMIDSFSLTELVQLTDEHDTGDIDDSKLDLAITKTDAIVDSYIGSRYGLPLSTVPDVLVNYACDIVRYKLSKDRVTEEVENRHKDAIDWLMRVANGKATLGIDEATADNVGGSVTVAQGESKIGWESY